jgi:predicted TIM-barrel fold metal-dependent hydrolase
MSDRILDRILMVSADGHAAMPLSLLPDYLEREYHGWVEQLDAESEEILRLQDTAQQISDEVLELIDTDGAIGSGGRTGSFDMARRLAEMDREGIAGEIIFPGSAEATPPFFAGINLPYPAEVRSAGARAYNRWLADAMAEANGRVTAIAPMGPWHDMDATVAEVRWAAAHGFRAVTAPGAIKDPSLPHLCDAYYEPFWKTCAELDVVVAVHAGHGGVQGEMVAFMQRLAAAADTGQDVQHQVASGVEGSPFAPTLVPTQILYSLMLGGVFDRYPELHFSLTEVRADWVPATLELLDRRFDAGDTPLRRRPSEYWRANCWAGASSIKRSEVRLRDRIGTDRMMFGRDYPHTEGTWPNTWDWLRDAFVGVSEVEIRDLLGRNAVACYRLDESALRSVSERLGPRPDDIMRDGPTVDARVVENFDQRGGYHQSYEVVDAPKIEALFEQDLAAARLVAAAAD